MLRYFVALRRSNIQFPKCR